MEELRQIETSVLLEIYGQLLTQKQREALDMHLNLDYSLAEIAENQNISRQAALDAIRRGSARLEELEAQLGIYAKFRASMENIEQMERAVEGGADTSVLRRLLAEARAVWEES